VRGRRVKTSVRKAGGSPFEFNTIGVDDGSSIRGLDMEGADRKALATALLYMEPALVLLRDLVLCLKHNLNARAIAGLSDEVVTAENRVDKLVSDVEAAVAEADEWMSAPASD